MLILALILLLAGCNSKTSQKDVAINTAGIFTPVSLSYGSQEVGLTIDLGEYLIGTGPKIYAFTVRNNSLFPLTKLGLKLENNESFGFNFQKNEQGKSIFPGKTGTCSSVLNPGQSCKIALQFETSITKVYDQAAAFTYVNYVEGATRNFNLTVLAGNPASLIFENEETNYYFGDLIGLAAIPVIEREINQEYSKTLTMINAGDLSARNLSDATIKLSQTCISAISKDCPSGQDTAYRITHNCPTILKSNERCQIVLYLRPKNQAATPSFKNIRYDGVVRINYQSSLEGTEGILNAYSTTNSVNIEAMFETSIESMIYENKVVVGNRDFKAFKINNRGFRSGFLRKLITKTTAGAHAATCIGNPLGGQWLVCYDETLTNQLTLAQFPFKIKDKDNCFANPIDQGKIIPVDQGCGFDYWFQPSVSYMTARVFDFELFAEYDSLWKGQETILENQLQTYYSESLAAALLVPVGINYNSAAIPLETDNGTVVTYDAGRVGLMSPSFFRRRSMLVTFKNIGGVPALNIAGKDGRDNLIPQKESNPAGVDIGTRDPKYYASSVINTADCTSILPGSSCTMQFNFAPITLFSTPFNLDNMFDVINTVDPLQSYKRFIMAYQDGSKYTDGNFDTLVVDSGPKAAEARLQMDLVEKGQLDEYSKVLLGLGGQVVQGKYLREAKFTNIGTKDIPYINYLGDVDLTQVSGVRVIATNPAKLNPSLIDCYGVIDFRYNVIDTDAVIASRSAAWDPLPVNTECLLTLEYSTPKRALSNSVIGTRLDKTSELGRTNYVAYRNTELAWDWAGSYVGINFVLDAYDGDLSDPSATNPYAATFGKLQPGKPLLVSGAFSPPAKLSIYSPSPLVSGIIYRPGWNRPDVDDEAAVRFLNASVVPPAWFFSSFNKESTAFGEYVEDFHKGILSKNFVPSGLPTLPTPDGYEYVVYLGAVPAGVTIDGSILLANSGGVSANLTSATLGTVLRPNPSAIQHFTTDLTSLTFPRYVSITEVAGEAVSNSLFTRLSFSGTDVGTYASELIVNYQDGVTTLEGPYILPIVGPDPRTFRTISKKILVVAEVINAPALQVSYQDYTVTTDDINPAVEALGTITPATMGWYENGSDPVAFTSIKIPNPLRKDPFIKRRFIFSNPSAMPIEEVKLFFRQNGMSTIKQNISPAPSYYSCFTSSKFNASLASQDSMGIDQPMCTGTCTEGPFTLAAGGSCYIEIRFQPIATTTTKAVALTALHKQGTDRYIHRNLNLTFNPQDPALVTILDRPTPNITTTAGGVRASTVDFGTVIQTTNPQVFAFEGPVTGGASKMLAFRNATTTKASFLKTYQTYYKQFVDPAITDSALRMREPTAGEFSKTVDGVQYALIFKRNYPSTTNPRIQVWANRECLLGTDDNTVPWFQRGFTGTDCHMIPILFADINYINRTLSTASEIDMDPNFVALQYYNSNRTSVGFARFHFQGTLKPNPSTTTLFAGADFYQQVKTTSTVNGQVTFRWNEMVANTIALGDIVSYRVFYSTSLAAVNEIYPAAGTSFTDAPRNGTGLYQLTQTNLGINKYMYYRVVPIRFNPSYNFNPNPFGLAAGHYLSDPSVPYLQVVVPNANFFYNHTFKYLVERDVYFNEPLTHGDARVKCTSRPRHTITDGGAVRQYTYGMVNHPVWNIIKAAPAESNYNIDEVGIWLDNSLVNIHATLVTDPEYRQADDLAYLYTNKIFYIKESGCGTNCSGNTAKGRAFAESGYTSYIEPTIFFAGARCYLQL